MADRDEIEALLELSVEARNPAFRVYVAGSSHELGRVKGAIRAVRRIVGPDAITADWTTTFATATPGADQHVSDREALASAIADLHGVSEAHLVWFLAPLQSRGAWVELGYAIARRVTLVVSGPLCRASIFTRLADELHETDMGGLYAVARLARQHAIEGERTGT